MECFRSSHPSVSFAAWGRHSDTVVGAHPLPLDDDLGESSSRATRARLMGQRAVVHYAVILMEQHRTA